MALIGLAELAARNRAQRLLGRFLDEPEGRLSRRYLEDLLESSLTPVIEGIIRRKTGSAARAGFPPYDPDTDAERLHDGALALILARLQQARDQRETIHDVRSLAAVLTFQAFAHLLEEKNPERRRLKQRVVYVLRTRPEHFTLEKEARGVLAASTRETGRRDNSARWQKLQDQPQEVAQSLCRDLNLSDGTQLPHLLERLLRWVDHPVPLDPLVSVVATLCGVREVLRVEASSDDSTPLEQVPDTRFSVAERVEAIVLLKALWTAIQGLPARQRVILLLHLRGDDGRSLLELLPRLGIADEETIATALELTPEAYLRLQDELPYDDRQIAERLKLSPENVRYLRHSARSRLAPQLNLWH